LTGETVDAKLQERKGFLTSLILSQSTNITFGGNIMQFILNNHTRIKLILLTLIFSTTCKAAEWSELMVSGSFRITPEASWLTEWKKGEGKVFYSFGRKQANLSGGDTEFQVLKRNYKPLQVYFGLQASHCTEVSLAPQTPAFFIPAFFQQDRHIKPHKLTVGHIYMIRCDKIVFLLDVHECSIISKKKDYHGYDAKCILSGRYTVLSTTMKSIHGKRGLGGSMGIEYSLPFIPLSIAFDSKEGIRLSCSGKIPTPIGVFEVYKNVSFPETNTLTIIIGDKKHIYDLENRPFTISLPNELEGKSKLEYDGKGNIIVVIPHPMTDVSKNRR
jgi:hypothetical protein